MRPHAFRPGGASMSVFACVCIVESLPLLKYRRVGMFLVVYVSPCARIAVVGKKQRESV